MAIRSIEEELASGRELPSGDTSYTSGRSGEFSFGSVGTPFGAGQNKKTYTFGTTPATTSSQTVSQTYKPTGPAPTFERQVFEAPEFDEREVAAETQRLQAPSIRKLRRQLQQTQTQRFVNPNVRRMTTRAALAGFGAGLESIQTGARREARQTVQQKYARKLDVAKTQFGADVDFAKQAYQRAWDLYLKSGTTTTTSGATPATATAAKPLDMQRISNPFTRTTL